MNVKGGSIFPGVRLETKYKAHGAPKNEYESLQLIFNTEEIIWHRIRSHS